MVDNFIRAAQRAPICDTCRGRGEVESVRPYYSKRYRRMVDTTAIVRCWNCRGSGKAGA